MEGQRRREQGREGERSVQGERDRESWSDEVRGLRREDADKKQTEGKRGNQGRKDRRWGRMRRRGREWEQQDMGKEIWRERMNTSMSGTGSEWSALLQRVKARNEPVVLFSYCLSSVFTPQLISPPVSSRVIAGRERMCGPITSKQHSAKWCWYFPAH